MKKIVFIFLAFSMVSLNISAQENGLTDMRNNRYAIQVNTPMGSVHWTNGFWGNRFKMVADTALWSMWKIWNDPKISHGFRNFEIAAGDAKGSHIGAPFLDGDMYKWLEACAAVYAVTKNPKLNHLMDHFIHEIAKAQRADGYIHTPVLIEERNEGLGDSGIDNTVIGIKTGNGHQKGALANRLNFETYNLGHLMTAGIIHKRVTGENTLFRCAKKSADFLCDLLQNSRSMLARNAICPSHYMGVAEMYRETGDTRYLRLLEELVDIRDSVKNGEDHNQDRIPFRQQYEATGHAVRANYLYAGVADLYAETGEKQLEKNLTSIWNDIASHKIYITGGCGALYDGVSPDGTSYDQSLIQQVHQAYGRKYQLPNETSHNETCAQVGQLLFSWRMFEVTGQGKYLDMLENELYNGILPGISLDGKRYFYTQALRKDKNFPYTLRWPKERQSWISCFCCPPNTVRTLAEAQEYAYSVNKDGRELSVTLYGANELKTKDLYIEQTTGYPWDGKIVLTLKSTPKRLKTIRLHIPGWAHGYSVTVNQSRQPSAGDWAVLTRNWKKGDQIVLDLPMDVVFMEANPLVEEDKNQVAVKRGPIVYCLEGCDIEGRKNINDIIIPTDMKLNVSQTTIAGVPMDVLDGEAILSSQPEWNSEELYRPVSSQLKRVHVRLIPYYAWGNRGNEDMTVWMNVEK